MEQYKAAVPVSERVDGYLYDAHSGVCMGIASDERKALTNPNTEFKQQISGCPHTLVYHKGRTNGVA